MRMTANVKRRFDTEHRILDKLYGIMKVGEDREGMAYPSVAQEIGEQVHAMLAAKRSFEDAGILRTRIEYPKGQSGRMSVWTLQLPQPIAHEELDKEHERQLVRPSTKEQRAKERQALTVPSSITRWIAGEDTGETAWDQIRSLKRDEPLALVESARQYRGRLDLVAQRVQEMRDQGIEVVEEAFRLPRDPVLESIALVVPAFDKVVRERDRLQEQSDRWATRIGEVQAERDHWKREFEGAQRVLRALQSERVSHST